MLFGGGRATLVVVAIYASVVACLLGLLPFWLDELLQLAGTHPGASMRQIVEYVPQNPGGVPLGYLIQHWVLAAAGLTRWTARLSAACFGIATCGAVAILA